MRNYLFFIANPEIYCLVGETQIKYRLFSNLINLIQNLLAYLQKHVYTLTKYTKSNYFEFEYKKAGDIIMDFNPDSEIQLSLFENSNPKHSPLMQVVDRINQSFGQQKIKLATQDQKRVWKMKQEKLSPRYTTRLVEVIAVRVRV